MLVYIIAIGILVVVIRTVNSFSAGTLIKTGQSDQATLTTNRTPVQDPGGKEFCLGYAGNRELYIKIDDFKRFCFILGATGSGKTVTIRNIFDAFIAKGFPVVYVDGKPSSDVIDHLKQKSGENFIGFNCDGFLSYDFLTGQPTEITDKIMCLKENWDSDYYKGLAQNILQLAIKFLQESKQNITLHAIIRHLDIDYLESEIRKNKSGLHAELQNFVKVKKADLIGIYSHLHYFTNSDFGKYLDTTKSEKQFTLEEVIEQNKCVYFALPALQYPAFATAVGKIVVTDLKNTIYRTRKPVLIILDEYSVFAGIQSLNLVNQGREFGSHLVISMQSLSDLPFPYESILDNANMLITHRINSDTSAETVAGYFGTKSSSQITTKVSEVNSDFEGSIRKTREFIVHPDEIKTLQQGEIFLSIKDRKIVEKVKVLMN